LREGNGKGCAADVAGAAATAKRLGKVTNDERPIWGKRLEERLKGKYVRIGAG